MRKRDVLRRLRREDDGQLLLLVLCYAVIGALLVTVVVNVSNAYLYRRALLAAADGAALAAANQPDLARVYLATGSEGAEPYLPLSQAAAARAVDEYVEAAQLQQRFTGFQLVNVATERTQVAVTMSGTVHMPFLNLVSASYSAGYRVDATSTARSPLVP
jgi:hypothetical protein